LFSFFPDGGIVAESGPANLQFQALLEYLVGMKLSAVNQNDEVCISALHQSSGNFSNRYANIKYFNSLFNFDFSVNSLDLVLFQY
jgi:predicted component of type VI protein secretion system